MLQVKRAITVAALALFASEVCNAEEKVAEEVVNGIPITSLHDDFNGSTVFRTPDVKMDAPTLNQRQAFNQLYYGRGYLAHIQIGTEASPVVVAGELMTRNAHNFLAEVKGGTMVPIQVTSRDREECNRQSCRYNQSFVITLTPELIASWSSADQLSIRITSEDRMAIGMIHIPASHFKALDEVAAKTRVKP